MAARVPVITLTTDFGTADPFVASMKGVILGIQSEVHIVDVSHQVAPHDVLDAAFRIRCGFSAFPSMTNHVVVVDPEVGTPRRPILMVTENHRFLAPDNGVLSLVPEVEEVRAVYHMTTEHYFRTPVSATFHGRDVFAPAAAWLARGIDPSNFGEPIEDWKRLELPRARLTDSGTIKGIIWSVDRFGNAISGISRAQVEEMKQKSPGPLQAVVGQHTIPHEVSTYHQIPKDATGFLINSFDLVEVAQNRRPAAKALGLKRGDPIEIRPAG